MRSATKQHLKIMKGAVAAVLVVAIVIPLFASRHTDAAGAASISLTPSTQTVTVNSTFNVTVAVNPAGTVAVGAQVKLNYDSSKLQFQSVTQNTTPLELGLLNSPGTGTLQVARATLEAGSSSSFNFMQVTFKAIAAGSASVSVQTGSEVSSGVDGSNIWNGTQTSATYTIQNPASPPPPSPTPTPTPTPTPSPTPKPTPTPTPSPSPTPSPTPTPTPTPSPNPSPNPAPTPAPLPEDLTISDLTIKNIFGKVVIGFKTSDPVKAKIMYGLDGVMAIASDETELTTNHSITLPRKALIPGRTYTYSIVFTKADGTVSQSEQSTFRARGYRLKLVIRYKDGKPVKKHLIRIHSEPREATSDDNGEVVFEDIEAGDHTVSFDVEGESIEQPVTVAANEIAESIDDEEVDIPEQIAEVQLPIAAKAGLSSTPIVAIGIISVAVLAGIAAVFVVKRKSMNASPLYVGSAVLPGQTPTTSVSDDEFLRPNPPAASTVVTPIERKDDGQDK